MLGKSDDYCYRIFIQMDTGWQMVDECIYKRDTLKAARGLSLAMKRYVHVDKWVEEHEVKDGEFYGHNIIARYGLKYRTENSKKGG